MQGSEKQVAWANEIKAVYVAALDALLATPRTAEFTPAQQELFAKLERIPEIDDAKWWIDNRSYLQPKSAQSLANATAANLFRGDFSLPE